MGRSPALTGPMRDRTTEYGKTAYDSSEIAMCRCSSDTGPEGRPGARRPRREYRAIRLAVQRADQELARDHRPGRCVDLLRSLVHIRDKEPAGGRVAEAGRGHPAGEEKRR